MRQEFPLGRLEVKVEQSEFQLHAYNEFLSQIKSESEAFRAVQQHAFSEERRRWAESGELNTSPGDDVPAEVPGELKIPAGCAALLANTTASVWQVHVAAGDKVEAGQRVFVLEAMKMEIAVHAARAGEVVEILCHAGSLVNSGQALMIYRPE
jgi:urea carboxylase